jgi:hypothetical protein
MMASGEPVNHEEVWLSLPWLANGRLSQAEREKLEPHVQTCAACREELALQRRFCSALTEPDRVTYAPGPSFRKLMTGLTAQPRRFAQPSHGDPRAVCLCGVHQDWPGRRVL